MPKRILFSILIIISAGFGQEQQLDSLEALLPGLEPAAKIPVLIDLTKMYLRIAPDKSVEFGKNALELARRFNDEEAAATAVRYIGNGFFYQGEFEQALEYYQESLVLNEALGRKIEAAKSLNNMGVIFNETGRYEKSLQYHLRALTVREELGDDRGIAASLSNIGNVNISLGNFETALEYMGKAIGLSKALGDLSRVADLLNNIGNIYHGLDRLDESLTSYEESLKFADEIGDLWLKAVVISNVAGNYADLEDYDKALSYYLQALEWKKELGDRKGISFVLINLGYLYRVLGQYEAAIESLLQGIEIAEDTGDMESLKDAYFDIKWAYQKAGRYKEAVEAADLFTAVRDSIYTEESRAVIAEMQARFDAEHKQKEIELLKKEADLSEIKLQKIRLIVYMSTGALIFALLLAAAVYSRYRIQKWADKQREEHIEKLQSALDEVKKLSGLLPMCANCKKIKNDKGYWEQVEDYISDHSEADFSHGFCPKCANELFPEYYGDKKSPAETLS